MQITLSTPNDKVKRKLGVNILFVLVKPKVKYVKAYDLRANHKVSNKKNPACTMPRKKNTVNLQ